MLPLRVDSQKPETKGKVSVPEEERRNLWLEILGDAVTGVAINPDSDLFMVGGSSLLLVHLQKAVKERFVASLPLQALYQSTTLSR
ncbi:uncharacterized protein RCC_11244 [Ramularia collo-cygni]|uniref:Carrier domain-containing protein n=1 Tax=Ramularia collo-cygni TaxID=112498 RepID=A0A2D3VLE0_9PEZI|nr:uncharacterized protein RCC_11244 [Ramularia collo-cygni]CZT25511.1 uncharacterized protein RCC_11244 [Ramularia collo-cygni]